MALIGIAIVKGDVAEFGEPAAVELLKSVIELGNASEQTGRNTDVLLKHTLKSAFGNMQFLLHF